MNTERLGWVTAMIAAMGILGCDSRSSDCSVTENGDGTTTISCPDGTSTTIRSGSDGKDGMLVRVVAVEPGADCAEGGQAILVGADENGNGILDEAEIESVSFVCDGVDGTDGADGTDGVDGADGTDGRDAVATLVRTTEEAPGNNCATGGWAILVGRDADGNGRLDEVEVEAVSYVCHGIGGEDGIDAIETLVRIEDEALGANCPAGGQAIHVGRDLNGNEVLDDEEVQTVAYVCHGIDGEDGKNGTDGRDGFTTLVRIEPEAPGANCAAGGQAILAGRDLNENDTLDQAEVETVAYVCNGIDGEDGEDGADGRDALETLVRVEPEAPGANCAAGGQAILTGRDRNENGTLDQPEVENVAYVCNGTPGEDGTDGLHALVSVSPEAPGVNCIYGGLRIQAGRDADRNGTLDEAEIESDTYVCHGAQTTFLMPGSTSAVMRDGWAARCLDWSGRVCLRPQVMVMCDVCSAYSRCGLWHDVTDVNHDFSDDSWQMKNFCAIATGDVTNTWTLGPAGSATGPTACNWPSPAHPQCTYERATYVPPVPGTHPLYGLSLEDGYCGAFGRHLAQIDCAAW